ncbi:nadh:flavin oxidoreductase nadh oxidase family protein [Penicillium angulare]|uniref:nadh:flavin oxidoreductase nadh oxidase family protein n=1 Tax=Penicillium angulare TaxID=116970 RepID=UPI002540CD39|nr:nadh:flavin oxidoreductase nadh oxidase family protein [Penicillium angulare]KAJ5291266.1 nadh:flavin oxidoreductase nadh oxidase family protein [Penicillium angulare]
MSAESPLFKPLQVGPVTLGHRIAMAPLTRFRADDDHVPLPFVADYYSQRGSFPGTLLVSEGTFIDARAGGGPNIPGIYNAAQIAAWKKITAAVHAKGSYIFCQLWALGRSADPSISEKEGIERLSASAIPEDETKLPAKAMTESDITDFVNLYAQAAKNAIEAGFDGVELHGANGYLIDQFIQDVSNKREDGYGGSIEARSRFCVEAVQAVVNAIGVHRTALRLSPWSTFQGMGMANPVPQFTHLINQLRTLDLAYIHLVESRVSGNTDIESSDSLDWAIKAWGPERPILLAGGFKPATARKVVEKDYSGYQVVVVFGRYFISTPDLPFRIKHGLDLEQYDRTQFYKPKSPEGFIDYPFSAEFSKI